MGNKIIYTIGHSTHSLETFIHLLKSCAIQLLVDVRRFPGSRKFPQFNQQEMSASLATAGILYLHKDALGGRRKAAKDSPNTRWRNASFRGYADYMQTIEFKRAIAELENMALQRTVAIMCSEAVWWRCHRSMISDYLKWQGWEVKHILSATKTEEHPYTSPAKIEKGKLVYTDTDQSAV